MLLCACPSSANHKVVEDAEIDSVAEAAKPKTISLLFAGDLMQHGVQYKAALQPDGTYNYDEVFRYVRDEISSADVAVANFETTLAGGAPSTYPRFNSPDSYLTACKQAGFDILTTCNNHSCDTGAKGLKRTIQRMDAEGIPHIGTYNNQAERDRLYPYVLDTLGFRIAMLSYTYGTNGIPVPSPYIVNTIDRQQISRDIKKAKSMNVDCIIAFVHWGIEHALLPNTSQKDLADWMFKNGVDHVIGGHPHVVEPIEVRPDAEGNNHLLVYSLGNYVSNMSKPNNDGGLMVKMQLTKQDGKTTMTDARYSLTWVSRPIVSGHKNFRIYPASVPDEMLNANERRLMNTTITTERKLFQQHNKGIQEYTIQWVGDKPNNQ